MSFIILFIHFFKFEDMKLNLIEIGNILSLICNIALNTLKIKVCYAKTFLAVQVD